MDGGSEGGLNTRNHQLTYYSLEPPNNFKPVTFIKRKMDLVEPKTVFLDTYLILYSELAYAHPVKGNNKHANIMVQIAS